MALEGINYNADFKIDDLSEPIYMIYDDKKFWEIFAIGTINKIFLLTLYLSRIRFINNKSRRKVIK